MSGVLYSEVLNNNEEINFRRLEEQDVFNMYRLHLKIIEGLKPGQECFMHKKSFNDFVRMVKNPDMKFIGGFVGNKLVCQAAIKFINDKNRDDNLPDIRLSVTSEKIALFEQVAVNNDYRGNQLGTKMVKIRENIAREAGKDCAVTMVDLKNYFSYRSHIRDGFSITRATIDPEDNGKIIYVYKDLHKDIEFDESLNEELDADSLRINQVNDFAEKGYFINNFRKDSKDKTQLILAKTDYFINLNNRKENKRILKEKVFAR